MAKDVGAKEAVSGFHIERAVRWTAKAGATILHVQRIEAMEFCVARDDDCRPEEVHLAQIALVGIMDRRA